MGEGGSQFLNGPSAAHCDANFLGLAYHGCDQSDERNQHPPFANCRFRTGMVPRPSTHPARCCLTLMNKSATLTTTGWHNNNRNKNRNNQQSPSEEEEYKIRYPFISKWQDA